jgi:hypothetical protein
MSKLILLGDSTLGNRLDTDREVLLFVGDSMPGT